MSLERIDPSNTTHWQIAGWEHLQRYQFAGQFVEQKQVLDCGCGIGYGSWCLLQYGAAKVTGLDISADTLATARKRYQDDRLQFIEGDSQQMPFEAASVDCVVCLENIEHLPEPPQFVAEAARVLRQDGILVVSAPNRLQFSEGPFKIENLHHLSEPNWEDLMRWLKPHFLIERQFEQSPVDAAAPELRKLVAEYNFSLVRKLECFFLSFKKRRQIFELHAVFQNSLARHFEVFPLLPERRSAASQFLFVCHQRNSAA